MSLSAEAEAGSGGSAHSFGIMIFYGLVPRGAHAPGHAGDFRGHCLNRPVAVRGAVPGDLLAVEIVSLTPDPWGWTVSPAVPDSPVLELLPRLSRRDSRGNAPVGGSSG
jgi:hypothetical protein